MVKYNKEIKMATIYDRSVNELLKEFVENWIKNDGVFQKKDAIDWFNENYPKIKASTVSAHITKFSVNNKNRAHYHAHSDGRDDILFRINENTFRKYNKITDSEPIYIIEPKSKKIEEDDETEYDTAFAYEEDLKNYLAKNLDIIESGLKGSSLNQVGNSRSKPAASK